MSSTRHCRITDGERSKTAMNKNEKDAKEWHDKTKHSSTDRKSRPTIMTFRHTTPRVTTQFHRFLRHKTSRPNEQRRRENFRSTPKLLGPGFELGSSRSVLPSVPLLVFWVGYVTVAVQVYVDEKFVDGFCDGLDVDGLARTFVFLGRHFWMECTNGIVYVKDYSTGNNKLQINI